MRYTERHYGKAVIKDKRLLPDALEKLAKIEEAEEQGKEFVRCSQCECLELNKSDGKYWCRNSQGLEYNITPNDGCTRGKKTWIRK